MALADIHVKKPREAQIWNSCTGNPVLRILPDSNNLEKIKLKIKSSSEKFRRLQCLKQRGETKFPQVLFL